MPELPEVETIRRQLSQEVVGYQIADFWTNTPKQVRPNPAEFKKVVVGSRIVGVKRRAKLLIFELEGRVGETRFFAVHLKLTGRLLLRRPSDSPDNFVHVVLSLSSKELNPKGLKSLQLRFADARKFGYFELIKNQGQLDEILADYGPEPLQDFSQEDFLKILDRTGRRVKEVLMDQKKISGIGNIYANDALWLAGIYPERRANSLTKQEGAALFAAITQVLQEGLKTGGASDQWYRQIHGEEGRYQKHFKVYGRAGQPCLRHPQQKILYKKIGQRGSFFCPQCQPYTCT